MATSKLYIVATPIGNKQDITLRALEILKSTRHVFAEDTREIGKLLELHGIPLAEKKLHSYASHNLKAATEKAVEILRAGEDIAMASDRGTPAISDPGSLLVARAREEGFTVLPIPGASSVTALLSVSGWDVAPFVFYGFWPTASGEGKRLLQEIAKHRMLSCFLESAQRVRDTVALWREAFPHGSLCWGREMTKAFEEYKRVELLGFNLDQLMEKGEYTLLLSPGVSTEVAEADWMQDVTHRLASEKDWAKWVAAKYGVASKEIYNALQSAKPK